MKGRLANLVALAVAGMPFAFPVGAEFEGNGRRAVPRTRKSTTCAAMKRSARKRRNVRLHPRGAA